METPGERGGGEALRWERGCLELGGEGEVVTRSESLEEIGARACGAGREQRRERAAALPS